METQPGCLAMLLAILVAIGGIGTVVVMSEDASVGPTPAPMLETSPAP